MARLKSGRIFRSVDKTTGQAEISRKSTAATCLWNPYSKGVLQGSPKKTQSLGLPSRREWQIAAVFALIRFLHLDALSGLCQTQIPSQHVRPSFQEFVMNRIRINFPATATLLLLVVLSWPTSAFAQREHVLYNVGDAGNNGATNMVADTSGNLYGGNLQETIFELSPPSNGSSDWTYATIATLSGWPTSLTIDKDGNIYGTTSTGGVNGEYCDNGCGFIFELSPPTTSGGAWTLSTIYEFPHGQLPDYGPNPTGLTIGPDGVLFGATRVGGNTHGYGAVFCLQPPAQSGGSWTFNVLYQFKGGSDGEFPNGFFAIDSYHNLYGTTINGGINGGACDNECGTVFELSPPTSDEQWTKTTLYNFAGPLSDGYGPYGGLFLKNGNLYGTTYFGNGTIFELSPPSQPGEQWTETILHNFTGTPDGNGPFGLAQGPDGIFYGATWGGGTYGGGTVFQLKPPAQSGGDWTESILYNFGLAPNWPQGAGPNTNVVYRSGAIYGETIAGGTTQCSPSVGCGVIYAVQP
jgi:uncharacterized repeat protein (TIGR03803 family)